MFSCTTNGTATACLCRYVHMYMVRHGKNRHLLVTDDMLNVMDERLQDFDVHLKDTADKYGVPINLKAIKYHKQRHHTQHIRYCGNPWVPCPCPMPHPPPPPPTVVTSVPNGGTPCAHTHA